MADGRVSDQRMRRLFTALLILTAVLATVSVFASAATRLTLWAWANQEVLEQFAAIAEWYQEENPDVEIEIAHIAGSQLEYTERFYLVSAGGAAPDVAWIEGSTVKQLAAQRLLEDVTGALEDIRFTPGETYEMIFAGKMYAAPYHCTSRGLFKRIDLLEQAGLDPHFDALSLDDLWTWNRRLSVISADGRYTRAGFVPWAGNWYPRGWIWAFGGELVDESSPILRPTADLPNNIMAYEWLDEWAQHYDRNRSPVDGGRNGLIRGSVAMALGSTSDAAVVIRDGIDFVSGRVPHPPEGRNVTWGGGYAVGVPTNTPNRQYAEATRLMRYFVSTEVQTRRFRQFESLIPANWRALMTIAPTLPPPYAGLIAQLSDARPRTPLSGEYHNHLTNAMNQVIAGTVTPRTALEGVQVIMEARFAEVFGQ
ncbi:MAG: extracellular solute-binding protein [Limnochordia bacterium]|jgi:multiple sugar transport system substrate-binding protein